jgi:hypothetical protein
VKTSSRCKKDSKNETIQQSVRGQCGSGRRFLPALVALGGGCGLLAGPVSALELGEIQVHSSLGQPLRASVSFALQPNEQIHDYCIYLKPGILADGFPSVSNAAITVGSGAIGITGRTAIREPLLSLQLTVDCPYSAHLRRDYSVFIDPALPAQLQAVAPAPAPASRRAEVPVRAASLERATASARPAARAPIPSSGTYLVQPGDSLSDIASRISGRSVGIWQAVDVIFAANAHAFIDNDRNLLRAGAVLAIPASILSPQATGTVRSAAIASQPAAPRTPESGQARLPVVTSDDAGSTSSSAAVTTTAAPAMTDNSAAAPALDVSASVPAATPAPGDVEFESDSPFGSPIAADAAVMDSTGFAAPLEVIPPTIVENAASMQTAAAVRGNPAATRNSWSWLIWLGGSGVALILALLLFGRRLKERFMPSYGAVETPGPRRTDSGSIDDAGVAPARGLPAQGTAGVARVVSLDADLEDGPGLQFGAMDVAQDFGFSDSGEFGKGLDLASAAAPDDSTDIFVPRRFAESSILVSETPPQHETTGEYDISMIIDPTRQILDESDDTAKDLLAVEVGAEAEETTSGEYTLNNDVDYKILEQDYEDEFSATQALSAELSRAARELSRQYGKDQMGDTLADATVEAAMDDETSLLPTTAPAVSGNDETTVITAAAKGRQAADDTAHLAISSNMTLDDTANEEIALDVPAADNDATVEVDIDSTMIVGTRKKRA